MKKSPPGSVSGRCSHLVNDDTMFFQPCDGGSGRCGDGFVGVLLGILLLDVHGPAGDVVIETKHPACEAVLHQHLFQLRDQPGIQIHGCAVVADTDGEDIQFLPLELGLGLAQEPGGSVQKGRVIGFVFPLDGASIFQEIGDEKLQLYAFLHRADMT